MGWGLGQCLGIEGRLATFMISVFQYVHCREVGVQLFCLSRYI